jgi:hypothetical protein
MDMKILSFSSDLEKKIEELGDKNKEQRQKE